MQKLESKDIGCITLLQIASEKSKKKVKWLNLKN